MFHVGVFSNPWVPIGIVGMALTQLLFTHSPVMNRVFYSTPLPIDAWVPIVGVGICAYLIFGFEKWARFRCSALRSQGVRR